MTNSLSKEEIIAKISELAGKCHQTAAEMELGDERTMFFSIANILRKLPSRGYAEEVEQAMNPLLQGCDDDDDMDDEWGDEE